MPIFKPFKGIRPSEDYLDCFPTHPLNNFSQKEIEQKAKQDFSYVKMVSPYLFGKKENLQENLNKVRSNYEHLVESKKLKQDGLCYYLYNQTTSDHRVFRGILGLVSVEDYNEGKIKKHEETLTYRKEKLAQYLEVVNLQAEPVLLTYPSDDVLEKLMDEQELKTPIIDYVDDEGARYKVWKIEDKDSLYRFENILSNVEAFYIADGHHRMESTTLCSEKKIQENNLHTGEEPYNFVYSFIVSEKSIRINDFNKVVTDLNGLTNEEFLEKLKENFFVEEKGTAPYFSSQKHDLSMYLDGKFYNLHLKEECCLGDCLEIIDHYLLEKFVLQPILGIKDLKTSKRVDYQRGTSCEIGIKNLKDKVDSGEYKVGFGACPVGFDDLIEVADQSLKMPPKCTYIEPKPVTALIMYDMK